MLGNRREIDFWEYDLVHVFNLQNIRLTPLIVKRAKEVRKPIVLSTIFWHSKNTTNYIYEMYKKYHPRYSLPINLSEKIIGKRKSLTIFDYLHKLRFFPKERYTLKNVDWILPESYSELEDLISRFKLPSLEKKATIIPNGLDEVFLSETGSLKNLPKNLPKEFVLSVGRIDPSKNQLNLVRALFNYKEIPFVFIGSKTGYLSFPKYINEFEKISEKRGNVYHFDNLPIESLIPFYQKARVYVQPSVWETFGITIFESAIFGCNLVITSEGGAKDYFKDKAFYCQPEDLDSIKNAVLLAWKKPKSLELAPQIRENFTWSKIVKEIIEVYKKVLSSR